MFIQLIGLPCSGKTTLLNKIKQLYPFITVLDINKFTGLKREKALVNKAKLLSKTKAPIIIESACGFEDLESIVILLRVSNTQFKLNQKNRKEFLTKTDKYRIVDQMLPPNYTVYNSESCETLIKTIINVEFLHAANSITTGEPRSH